MLAYTVLLSEGAILIFTIAMLHFERSLLGTLFAVTLAHAALSFYVSTKVRKVDKRTKFMEDAWRNQQEFNSAFLSSEVLEPVVDERLLIEAKVLVRLRTKLVRLSTGGLQGVFTSATLARMSDPLLEYERTKKALLTDIGRAESRFDSLYETAEYTAKLVDFEIKSKEKLLSLARAHIDEEDEALETKMTDALSKAGFTL